MIQIGRNSRLGLRPVNPNPLPPNSPLGASQQANTGGAAGPGGAGGRGHGPHNGNNGRGNNQHGQGQGQQGNGHGQGGQGQGGGQGQHGQGGHGGHGGGKNNKPPPGTPPTGTVGAADPNNPFAIPTYTPGQGQPDPRDQTYYTNVARLQAQAQQAYQADTLAQRYANTDYARAQEQLALNQQADQQNLAGDALRSGLSSSGYLRRASAQQTGNYILQGGDLSSTYNRDRDQRTADMASIIQNYGLGAAQELAGATDRFTQLQLQQAQSGEGITTKADLKAIKKMLQKAKKGKGGGGGGHGGNNGNGGHGGHGGNH